MLVRRAESAQPLACRLVRLCVCVRVFSVHEEEKKRRGRQEFSKQKVCLERDLILISTAGRRHW